MSEEGRKHIDPRLLALMDKAEKEDGLFIRDLKAGDTVTIRTRNHMYVLKIIDPEERKVEAISNGQYFQEPAITYANGSSLTGTGTMIKSGWIAVGYRFLLGNIVLSETQSVTVNGVQILPFTSKTVN